MVFAMKWESPSSQWKANRVGPSQLPAPEIPGSMDLKQGSSVLPHNTRSSNWAAPRGVGVGGLDPSVACPPQWVCLGLFVMDSKVEKCVSKSQTKLDFNLRCQTWKALWLWGSKLASLPSFPQRSHYKMVMVVLPISQQGVTGKEVYLKCIAPHPAPKALSK